MNDTIYNLIITKLKERGLIKENHKSDYLEKLEFQLKSDFESPNSSLIKTWIDNYLNYVKTNNLDKDEMFDYMLSLFKKYDIKRVYSKKTLNDYYFNRMTDLKQSTKYNDNQLEALRAISLFNLPKGNLIDSNFSIFPSFIISKLSDKLKENSIFKKYLNEENLKISDKNELISNDKIINLEMLINERYKRIKQVLLNINIFNDEYSNLKSKLLSMMINSNPYKKMKKVKSVSKIENNILDIDDKTLFKKGMSKVL